MAAVPPAAGAAAPPLIDGFGVVAVLTRCGCNNNQRNAIINGEGVNTMNEFKSLQESDITEMAKRLISLRTGSVRLGQIQINKIKSLVFWVHERERLGQNLDANAFTQDVLEDVTKRHLVGETTTDTPAADTPPKFKPNHWVSWFKGFQNYLSSITSHNLIPLSYVIRKNKDPGYAYQDDDERRFYTTALAGPRYQLDRKRVWQILKQLLLETDGYVWIQEYENSEDGRAAVQNMISHYDGPGETSTRLANARRMIAESFYRSEKVFSFEKYSSKLKEAFQILDDNRQPEFQDRQVQILCDHMQTQDPSLLTGMTMVRMTPGLKDNFRAACENLSELINVTKPLSANRGGIHNPYRRTSALGAERGGRGGRGGGRGRLGRGGRGRGCRGPGGRGGGNPGSALVNGVDCSDLTRYYENWELDKLPKFVRDQIWNAKADAGVYKRRKTDDDGPRDRNISVVEVTAEADTASLGNSTIPSMATGNGGAHNGNAFGTQSYQTQGRGKGRGRGIDRG